MTKTLFISLPVADLGASTAFYKALGFSQNPQLNSEDGSAMVWSESIQVMLVTHAKWRTFTQRPFPPAGSCGMMLSLALESRAAVDAMNQAAAGPWRAGRCEPDGGPRLHVHPRPGRSRRSHVGGALDGPGGDVRHRHLNASSAQDGQRPFGVLGAKAALASIAPAGRQGRRPALPCRGDSWHNHRPHPTQGAAP
jgi:predicted lactoylglutathione lyase